MGIQTKLTEKEFLEMFPEEKVEIPIYFYLDDDGKVVIDEESIRDEFEEHIKKFYGCEENGKGTA